MAATTKHRESDIAQQTDRFEHRVLYLGSKAVQDIKEGFTSPSTWAEFHSFAGE